MSIRQDLATQLKDTRISIGMTQKQLSERVRIQQPTVATVEKYGPASFAMLERFCEALGVDFQFHLVQGELVVEDNKRGPYKSYPGMPIVLSKATAKKVRKAEPGDTITLNNNDVELTYEGLEAKDLGQVLRDQDPEPRVESEGSQTEEV